MGVWGIYLEREVERVVGRTESSALSAVSALAGGIRRIRSIAASMRPGPPSAFARPVPPPPTLVDPSSFLLLQLLCWPAATTSSSSSTSSPPVRFRCFRPNSVARPSSAASSSVALFPFRLLCFLCFFCAFACRRQQTAFLCENAP